MSPKNPFQECFDSLISFENSVSLVESCLITTTLLFVTTLHYFLLVVDSRKFMSKPSKSLRLVRFAFGDCLATRLESPGHKVSKPLIGPTVAGLSWVCLRLNPSSCLLQARFLPCSYRYILIHVSLFLKGIIFPTVI